MLSRLTRREDGFALPLTLSVIAIVAALSAVAIAFATHSIERSSRDRLATRAQAAADAGADAAAYRMSRALLASKIEGLLTPQTTAAVLAESVGCLGLGVNGTDFDDIVFQGTVSACPSTQEEIVAQEVGSDGVGPPATFRYWVQTRAEVPPNPGNSIIEREIVVVGKADDVLRRIKSDYRFDLEAPANALIQRVQYVECTAIIPAPGTDPTAGCPS